MREDINNNEYFVQNISERDGVTRRDFMKCSSALLGGAFLATQFEWAADIVRRAEAGMLNPEEEYELAKAENIIYSVCLQCNTGCGIKVKLYKGIPVKIDGNPYDPFCMVPSVPMEKSPFEMAKVDAAICPKGQAGIQTLYDPYRITKVLKRAGKRGENKWETISFEKAIDEIVNGGRLFNNVPGEEDRVVAGLKEICALRDPKIAKEMADDVKKIYKEKDKKKAVEEFKNKHKDNLHYLIDPDHPDFGPKNNQFVYMWGRQKAGRGDFIGRFFGDYFGTVNTHGHTTVCQGSLYFTCKALSEKYEYNKFGGGKKFYFQGDIENSKYVLFVGSNLFDANYGPTNRSVRITQRLANKELKIAVADPRFSKLASKADKYLPVNPGTDAALFMAIMQWIIKNKRYDEKYLTNANKAAAIKSGESTWTNASLLVKLDKDGKPGKFLRAHEIGIADPEKRKDKDGKEHDFEYLVALQGDTPVKVDYNDENNPVKGDLFVTAKINDIPVKSAMQILYEEVASKTMQEWSSICGVSVSDIEEVAKELTSYGKMACVDVHRGIAQHTNGFYNVTAAMTINMLLGNFDWKGGMIAASSYSGSGGKEGQPFDMGKLKPGKTTKFGISIIRHDIKYEDSTIFSGYPAKRNWWPISSDVYEEIIPSIGDAYPYPVKALYLYMGAPNYSLPAAHTNSEILADVNKIPLFITSDIVIGSTSVYADYIFPDLSYLERWEFQGSHPNMPAKVQPIRQPVAPPLTETAKAFGEEMPCSHEAFLLAVAEKLNFKGYGKNGFGEGQDFTRPDDFYIRMVANIATDGKAVPDASDEEIKLFMESRKYLPKTVFDPERWQKITGGNWKKVVYLLNRGGRFQDYKDIYKGDKVSNQYKSSLNLYQEKTVGTKNAFTGKGNPGWAKYIPISTTIGKTPKEMGLEDGYDLHLITQRDIAMTKSRTISNYWLLTILPENWVFINTIDAKKYGLKSGDEVKIVSATNPNGEWFITENKKKPIIGKIKMTETIKPGVITFTIGHGHWSTGAVDMIIDNKIIKGDPKRATGFNANAAMWIDPYLKNTCMIDPVGGSVSFYDTKVKLVKI